MANLEFLGLLFRFYMYVPIGIHGFHPCDCLLYFYFLLLILVLFYIGFDDSEYSGDFMGW